MIAIDSNLKTVIPNLILGIVLLDVKVEPSREELLCELNNNVNRLSKEYTNQLIREFETVKSTKDAYRMLGKDPSRYRPAAESLMRRVAKGKGLYHINNAVDVLNMVSLTTGYSICGYDFDKIVGDITMGIGEKNEPYQGIGRGQLNIERLPVFRDSIGAFGNATSDSVRTIISDTTSKMLFVIVSFDGSERVGVELDKAAKLYCKYVNGEVIDRIIIKG